MTAASLFLCQQKINAQDSETAENVRFWVRQFHCAGKRMIDHRVKVGVELCTPELLCTREGLFPAQQPPVQTSLNICTTWHIEIAQ